MVWVKVDDSALTSPRWLALPRAARLLHLEALSWSNRHAADGVIPRAALTLITDEPETSTMVVALIKAGAWVTTDTGWRLVWLLDDQPTAEEQEQERAKWRERKERNRRHQRGDHALCDPFRCRVLLSRRDSTRESRGDSTRESRPPDSDTDSDPTRPQSGTEEESRDDQQPEGRSSGSGRGGGGTGLVPTTPRAEQIANLERFLEEHPDAVPASRDAAERSIARLKREDAAS